MTKTDIQEKTDVAFHTMQELIDMVNQQPEQGEYTDIDLAVAWELYDRVMTGDLTF